MDKCICCFEEFDGFVFANIDCPVHGALHGKNPYSEEFLKEQVAQEKDYQDELDEQTALAHGQG